MEYQNQFLASGYPQNTSLHSSVVNGPYYTLHTHYATILQLLSNKTF